MLNGERRGEPREVHRAEPFGDLFATLVGAGEFSEVLLAEVRIPTTNRVGAGNDGRCVMIGTAVGDRSECGGAIAEGIEQNL